MIQYYVYIIYNLLLLLIQQQQQQQRSTSIFVNGFQVVKTIDHRCTSIKHGRSNNMNVKRNLFRNYELYASNVNESDLDESSDTPGTVKMSTTISTTKVVSLPILDITKLVQKKDETSVIPSRSSVTSTPEIIKEKQQAQPSVSSTISNDDDPLVAQILLDVQQMRQNEQQQKDDDDGIIQQEGLSVSKILSTIVTVDFFIVMVFFLWFLLGIAASYIIKDDTIQIAFNSNFQTLVQPALGILMIASISDAVFKQKEE